MSPEAVRELLAILARLPAEKAAEVRRVLLEAGVDLSSPNPALPQPKALGALAIALAALVGLLLALLIAILLTR